VTCLWVDSQLLLGTCVLDVRVARCRAFLLIVLSSPIRSIFRSVGRRGYRRDILYRLRLRELVKSIAACFWEEGGVRTADINLYLAGYNEPVFCICPLSVEVLELVDGRIVEGCHSESLLHWTLDQSVGQNETALQLQWLS
jgi:hypothetical protein